MPIPIELRFFFLAYTVMAAFVGTVSVDSFFAYPRKYLTGIFTLAAMVFFLLTMYFFRVWSFYTPGFALIAVATVVAIPVGRLLWLCSFEVIGWTVGVLGGVAAFAFIVFL